MLLLLPSFESPQLESQGGFQGNGSMDRVNFNNPGKCIQRGCPFVCRRTRAATDLPSFLPSSLIFVSHSACHSFCSMHAIDFKPRPLKRIVWTRFCGSGVYKVSRACSFLKLFDTQPHSHCHLPLTSPLFTFCRVPRACSCRQCVLHSNILTAFLIPTVPPTPPHSMQGIES